MHETQAITVGAYLGIIKNLRETSQEAKANLSGLGQEQRRTMLIQAEGYLESAEKELLDFGLERKSLVDNHIYHAEITISAATTSVDTPYGWVKEVILLAVIVAAVLWCWL